MKKSFKKAIAVLLAVLMVAFSVPFTALAAPGDYEPNIDMIFGTFHENNASAWTDYGNVTATPGFDYCGLFDVPLTYDAKAGTLTLEKVKADKANEIDSFTPIDADYVYGVGDYFTATVTLDNVDHMFNLQAWIKYSDNIEPAGVYNAGGRPVTYKFGSYSEMTGNAVIGFTSPVEAQSAVSYYDSHLNVLGGAGGMKTDNSSIDPDARIIKANVGSGDGSDTVDISTIHDDYFADPNTGDLSTGYTYEGVAILETFVFKIVAPGPITFEMADPENNFTGFSAGYFVAAMSDGIMNSDYTTYSPNGDNPGSSKMTFFGKNEFVDEEEPEPEEHVHSYTSEYVDPTCEDDGYWIYTCESDDGLACDEPEYTKPDTGTALGHDYNGEVAVAGDGEHYYACLNECGTYGFEGVEEATEACTPTIDGEDIAATCAQQGYKAARVCEVCEQVLEAEETLPKSTEHTGNIVPDTDVNKAATCTDKGWEGATKCELCGETVAVGNETPALGHDYQDVEGTAKEATCTEAARTADQQCSRCDSKIEGTETGSALGHDYQDVEGSDKAPTCTEAGKEVDQQCSRCESKITGKEIEALGHDYDGGKVQKDTYTDEGHYVECVRFDECGSTEYQSHAWMQTAPEVPAGPGTTGTTAVEECPACGATRGGDTIPAEPVPGTTYNVTIVSKPLGSTTIQYYKNGELQTATIEATEEYGAKTQTFEVDHDTQIVITATPNEGAEFVGWMVNDSILNAEDSANDNPHTGTVLADITYEPIFQHISDEDAKFTVIFTDKYGNIYSTQTVESGAEIDIPAGPVYVGYTFTGWSMSEAEIKALTSAATIYSRYQRNVEETFTVTANGATITTPYATAQNVGTGIGYDTEVTVYAEGATAWYINGVVVGYGESYTFYVGANVELTYTTGDVTETPVVAAVSVEKIGTTGAIKASFLASRKVVNGFTYVNAGFIYGANVNPAELTLGSVDQDAIRAYYCTTSSEQFALNVGLKAQTGKLAAAAFLAYVENNGDGSTKVVYAPFEAFDYDA